LPGGPGPGAPGQRCGRIGAGGFLTWAHPATCHAGAYVSDTPQGTRRSPELNRELSPTQWRGILAECRHLFPISTRPIGMFDEAGSPCRLTEWAPSDQMNLIPSNTPQCKSIPDHSENLSASRCLHRENAASTQ